MSIFNKKPKYPLVPVHEVHKMLIDKLATALRPHGFKRTGSTYYRQQGEIAHIINVQGDKYNQGYEATYYINLAVYYGPALEIEWGNPMPITPKEYDGQLRNRLGGKGIPSSWEFSPKANTMELADKLVDAVVGYGVPYFEGIDSPLRLADCILDKNKNGMGMITDHISRALIFSLNGDKAKAQTEFDTYFKKNKRLQDDFPSVNGIKRQYLCIAKKVNLQLDYPELDGETCVGLYVHMKGKRLINDERRTHNKVELYLGNLEKKGLGYIHYYGALRKPGMYRIGFCTKDPTYVVGYIEERQNKLAAPLAGIVASDDF